MKLPYWFKFKRVKDGVLIYDLRKGTFFFSNSLFLYLILKQLEIGNNIDQISELVSQKYNISFKNVMQKINQYLTALQKIINDKSNTPHMINKIDVINMVNYDFESPLVISLLLTYRCNLKCRHCLVGSFRFSKKYEMGLECIKKLALQMKKYEVFKIILNGGEPTIRDDFIEILQIFYQDRIPIYIVTNGINLSKENIEIYDQYNVVEYSVSLEGADSKTNDFIRGEGTFNKVLRNIANLKKYSHAFRIDVEVTYGKHNLSQIEKIINVLYNMGVTSIKFARLKPWNWGSKLIHLVPDKEEIIGVNEKLENLKTRFRNIEISGDMPQFNKNLKIGGCNVNISFEIQPDGNVLPCRIFEQQRYGQITIGNINYHEITEIWNNKKAKQIRRYSEKLNEKFICSQCGFTYYCPTNYCIAENYLKFGRFIPSVSDLKRCRNHQ